MAGEIRIGCDTLCFLFDRGILLIEAVYIVRLGKVMVVGIIQISWFFFFASAHVENLCPDFSQILPAGNTPRFAWRELRPQGPRAVSVYMPWPDRSWGDQWHGWRGAIPPESTVSTWLEIPEMEALWKNHRWQKWPSFSIAMFDSERYLSWWSTFFGFWRFGVALQMLILLPKNYTVFGWFLTQKPQLDLARPWLQCGKRPMYKNARETEQHGSKCLCGAGWAEGWLLVVGITSWVLRWWLACSGTSLEFFVANKNYQTSTVADFK